MLSLQKLDSAFEYEVVKIFLLLRAPRRISRLALTQKPAALQHARGF
ncbi:hypothetical protein HMPREF0541_03016 [Lacticaseibacillus rhamnosus ATCC 21052]|nr:hypothetical protein HMPREF0541_03016 [Lacticaseibacillus rhamnosus ATCC 21052]